MAHTLVSGATRAAIFLFAIGNLLLISAQNMLQFFGVGRTVIDDDDLPILKCLGENRIKRFAYVIGSVVRGNDYADRRRKTFPEMLGFCFSHRDDLSPAEPQAWSGVSGLLPWRCL